MNAAQSKSQAPMPKLLLLTVLGALLVNGLLWAVRMPPLHANDEAQHYLYATQFDGTDADATRGEGKVPRDLQALGQVVEFGPQRRVRQPIDLSEERSDEIARLLSEADNPELASVYVDESKPDRLIGHTGFEDYHPPTYYVLTGQTLRLGHAFGLGVRGRLLLARSFSILLGLLAVWLAILLARVVWPGNPGLAALVGLAMGWQATIAFYTSVVNNDALAFPLFTLFLLIGALFIRNRPSVARAVGMVGVGAAAALTKFTALALVPLGLMGVALSSANKRSRLASVVGAVLIAGAVGAWLLVPLGGGGAMAGQYLDSEAQPRSFPAEMFTVERVRGHVKMMGHLWGNQLGNAVLSDAGVPRLVFYAMFAVTALAYLLGFLRLCSAEPGARRVLLWLVLPPVLIYALLYVIDYRFASMSGGRFFSRAQYFVMCAPAMMVWTVWGLLGWFRGKALAGAVCLFALFALAYNLVFLIGLIGPRYYGPVGWWGQCEAVATIWPVPAWGVAGLDVLAVLSGLAAVVLVVRASEKAGRV